MLASFDEPDGAEAWRSAGRAMSSNRRGQIRKNDSRID
jgi:hypothetical protein